MLDIKTNHYSNYRSKILIMQFYYKEFSWGRYNGFPENIAHK